MLNRKIIKNVECAVPHKCAKSKDSSKRCAQCEIGYSFFACEPITLECGHLICFDCKPKVDDECFKCNNCGANAKCSQVKGIFAETLFHHFNNEKFIKKT
jgi:hypothetical protein